MKMRNEQVSRDSMDDDEDAAILNNRYATDETPLLGRDSPEEPRSLYRQNVLILIAVFIFTAELAAGVYVAPSSAVMENIICRSHYPDVSPNIMAGDPRCKEHEIQGTLAMIRGWANTFECIPGIIATVPYGILSDKWGRKPVFVLSMFGIVLAQGWVMTVMYFPNVFPLWAIWFGSAFQFIGGSSSVVSAMLYTMGADVTPANER
jgi:MFS family permease